MKIRERMLPEAITEIITGYYSFMTNTEDAPWWMVDLGERCQVHEVVIYNVLYPELLAGRAVHLSLSLSPDGKEWSEAFSRQEETVFGGADGHPLRIKLEGQSARFVRVGLQGWGTLHLDEIEVYGLPAEA